MEALIDTHCHIHDSDYDFLQEDVLKAAKAQKVVKLICVGTDLRSSKEAIDFALQNAGCYASFGLHPHLATQSLGALKEQFQRLKSLLAEYKKSQRLVALGECGLDYFYHRDSAVQDRQKTLFRWQLDLAQEHQLPLILHVRDAFKDFWPLYRDYQLPAVLHSFSDSFRQIPSLLSFANLYCGLNGIMTFSQNKDQLRAAKEIPLKRLLVETDAPYLTPVPHRGKINKPEYVRLVADFLATLRGEDPALLARQTTLNAQRLFKL